MTPQQKFHQMYKTRDLGDGPIFPLLFCSSKKTKCWSHPPVDFFLFSFDSYVTMCTFAKMLHESVYSMGMGSLPVAPCIPRATMADPSLSLLPKHLSHRPICSPATPELLLFLILSIFSFLCRICRVFALQVQKVYRL